MVGNRFLWATALFGALVISACGQQAPPGAGLVTVVGAVTRIDDRVPVDGGVTIDLLLDDGPHEVLLFESLFTNPPPTEERLQLYEKIGRVVVGSRVRAVGEKRPDGIWLEDIEVLIR